MAGLIGAGRTELCRAHFRPRPDRLRADLGRWQTVRSVSSPGDAVDAGIALIPEDRGRDGLARELPIDYNVTMASLGTRQSAAGSSATRRRTP